MAGKHIFQIALLLGSLIGCASSQELTQEELWATDLAIYHSQEVWYYKAPMEAALPDFQTALRLVSSDEKSPIAQEAAPLPVHFAQSLPPVQSGVTVSYSSQGAAALESTSGKRIKGFQMVKANVCAGHDAKVPVGLVIQEAGSLGIQSIDNQMGLAIVRKTISLNWRTIGKVGLVAVLAAGTALTVGGVISVPVGVTRGLTFGHLFVDQILPPLFSVGAPQPDPFVNAAMDEDSFMNLAAGSCKRMIFGAVYPKSIVTGPIPLMP